MVEILFEMDYSATQLCIAYHELQNTPTISGIELPEFIGAVSAKAW